MRTLGNSPVHQVKLHYQNKNETDSAALTFSLHPDFKSNLSSCMFVHCKVLYRIRYKPCYFSTVLDPIRVY